MPSITGLLRPPAGNVTIGQISQKQFGNNYLVSIGTGQMLIPSAVTGTLQRGSRVLLSDTGTGLFIIGQSGQQSTQQEIIEIEG